MRKRAILNIYLGMFKIKITLEDQKLVLSMIHRELNDLKIFFVREKFLLKEF